MTSKGQNLSLNRNYRKELFAKKKKLKACISQKTKKRGAAENKHKVAFTKAYPGAKPLPRAFLKPTPPHLRAELAMAKTQTEPLQKASVRREKPQKSAAQQSEKSALSQARRGPSTAGWDVFSKI
ncbi:MAG: hypothetical protein IKA53_00280 [Clostridia bacterium]|nr:hypothetical protein [Clostridia bacterium]